MKIVTFNLQNDLIKETIDKKELLINFIKVENPDIICFQELNFKLKKYIEEKNCLIENSNIENINVVNCYEFDEVKDEMNEIVEEHDNTLNTLGN